MELTAVLHWWEKLSPLPGGKTLYSQIIKRFAPYTGSIGAKVDTLEPGYARIILKDKRSVRNHLNSIHAVALMNLAEMSSGLSLTAGVPAGCRAILTGFEIEFIKKARGTLTSECRTEIPTITGKLEHFVPVEVKDASGAVVCRAKARWTLDRKKA